jgi:hypothetical protein
MGIGDYLMLAPGTAFAFAVNSGRIAGENALKNARNVESA